MTSPVMAMDHGRSGVDAGTTRGTCAFWLVDRCLGLDVGLVGEVVGLHAVTPVPMAHESVRGVFNLRGAPVVVLDLAQVLQLADGDERRGTLGLVLRVGDMVAAVPIDRVEAIIPGGRGVFVPRDAAGDHPAVLGLLDDREVGGRVITVLDPAVVAARLQALRYVDGDDE